MRRMIQSFVTHCMPAALAATLASAPANAGVYRCTVNGVTRYSDTPCRAGDAPLALPDANVVEAPKSDSLAGRHDARVQAYQKARADEDAQWREQHDADAADAARIRNARVHGVAVIGMSAADVRAALGSPERSTASSTAKGKRETWTYEQADGQRTTVTLQNDIVSAVRSSQRGSSRKH